MTSTPTARALLTVQCGAGWVSGTPGLNTRVSKGERSRRSRSPSVMPWAFALPRAVSESSQAVTIAPPRLRASATARPERASPKTATFFPCIDLAANIEGRILSELERGEAEQRQNEGDDPEADHDRRFLPALLLKMMMQGRHGEYAPAPDLEGEYLDDNRYGFEHEKTADHQEHDLVLGGNRNGAERAAERERACVAHEDHGRGCVEPQEAEAGTDDRSAEDRKLARPFDEMHLQVIGKNGIAHQIDDDAISADGNHHRDDREPVEAVGQIDRIAGADNHERAHQDEAHAERYQQILEERQGHFACERRLADAHKRVYSDCGDEKFAKEPHPAREALGGGLGDFQKIIIEADGTEPQHDKQNGPDIEIEEIRPDERRYDDAGKDHQPAHCRRALLLHEMPLRAVGPDRLAPALLELEQRDQSGSEHEDEKERGQHRRAGARGGVAKGVKTGDIVLQRLDQIIEHPFPSPRGRRTLRTAGYCRKSLLYRLDQRAHAAAQRAFHHDHVPRPQIRDEGFSQTLRTCGVFSTAVRRNGIPQMAHERATGI